MKRLQYLQPRLPPGTLGILSEFESADEAACVRKKASRLSTRARPGLVAEEKADQLKEWASPEDVDALLRALQQRPETDSQFTIASDVQLIIACRECVEHRLENSMDPAPPLRVDCGAAGNRGRRSSCSSSR